MKARNFTFDSKRLIASTITQKDPARQRQSIVIRYGDQYGDINSPINPVQNETSGHKAFDDDSSHSSKNYSPQRGLSKIESGIDSIPELISIPV